MDRRGFITGLVSLIAAPAIVRAGGLMPVKIMRPTWINTSAPGPDFIDSAPNGGHTHVYSSPNQFADLMREFRDRGTNIVEQMDIRAVFGETMRANGYIGEYQGFMIRESDPQIHGTAKQRS